MSTKNCREFMDLHPSLEVNCLTCKSWNNEDFVCMDEAEIKRRELEALDREIRRNRGVRGPL